MLHAVQLILAPEIIMKMSMVLLCLHSVISIPGDHRHVGIDTDLKHGDARHVVTDNDLKHGDARHVVMW